MTAANNGAGTPENDDPFGYLYEDGQAAGATPPGQGRGYGYPGPAAQPGVPRTSYNQVRTVGERRQYTQPQVPPQQGHGQQGGYGQQQQGYGQPTAAYAAPETYPGGPQTRQTSVSPQGGHGRGGGPNTRGLLIGAIAVVAVVVIGIGAALMTSGDEKDKANGEPGTGGSPTAAESVKPSEQPSKDPEGPVELPKQDAATLSLGGPATAANTVPGAKGTGGGYVMFNGEGGSASWSVDVPEAGAYTMYLTYSVPGKDAKTSLTINGQTPRELNMANFAKAGEGDWEKGWTNTYAYVNLNKGKNDLKISCEAGNQCDAYLDQVWLEAGQKG
ncbi:carbohydrate-binding protein [Streptomyces zhihengii]|uniref:Carbohydrate-binding protein n=1 Tax=Streptomyces zhihengii TaxID=1818004 RepID=A0ABS2UTI6_9ACTN|nr:carbohydrate-binding protein [Streptomyces zhihengii]MBM9620814.1 carbohydrate-binding protein [Streptomyces zhihengii]